MKTKLHRNALFAIAILASPAVQADPSSPEITGLQKAAADFVVAFNNKDSDAIAALFTDNGEITDSTGGDVTSGKDDIKARYQNIFSSEATPSMAVEVESVRLVGKDLAIEDGTVHLTPPGEDEPARSTKYTAVLQKNDTGLWQIASSRTLQDATDAAGQLADLAHSLKGDWTCQKDGLRLDLAFGWDESGKFLSGEMLATASDAKPLKTNIRIGWDAARKTITWWTFDDAGGFAKGDWTATEDGWLIRTEGTSAEGESTSANQNLVFDGKDTILWTAKDRLVDGERLPDNLLRVVRQAPEPAAE